MCKLSELRKEDGGVCMMNNIGDTGYTILLIILVLLAYFAFVGFCTVTNWCDNDSPTTEIELRDYLRDVGDGLYFSDKGCPALCSELKLIPRFECEDKCYSKYNNLVELRPITCNSKYKSNCYNVDTLQLGATSTCQRLWWEEETLVLSDCECSTEMEICNYGTMNCESETKTTRHYFTDGEYRIFEGDELLICYDDEMQYDEKTERALQCRAGSRNPCNFFTLSQIQEMIENE